MKKNALIIFLVAAIIVLSDRQLYGQLPWTKDANNPILSGGASGTWNRHVYWPHVLYNADSARYEMWFNASENIPNFEARPLFIGFASSPDGITWTIHPDPVLEPDPGTWDENTVEEPYVIRESGQYKMWYISWDPDSPATPSMIGYATSSDGINWVKDSLNNPVMVPGPDAWQANGFTAPSVLPFEGGYKMWYTGWTANWVHASIGYATSPDGITWTPNTLNNPVLKPGSSGRWDDGNLVGKHVMLIDTVYHIWYTGTRPSEAWPWQIGWATSSDGFHWNKFNDNSTTSTLYLDSDPVVKPSSGQWDGSIVMQGTVMHEGDSLRMWYTGTRSPSSVNLWRIGHAKAPYDGSIVDGIEDNSLRFLPQKVVLSQNYPNPFNPSTTIEFHLSKSADVRIEVFNIAGQKIKTLVNKKMSAGTHQVQFNAQRLTSGVYFYRIEAGEFQDVKKMIIIK
jgi:predicted GH43/DUF377 family glycosyl hydrolase